MEPGREVVVVGLFLVKSNDSKCIEVYASTNEYSVNGKKYMGSYVNILQWVLIIEA